MEEVFHLRKPGIDLGKHRFAGNQGCCSLINLPVAF
jgi:hypothetical protein